MKKTLLALLMIVCLGVSNQVNAQSCSDVPVINSFEPNTGFIGSIVEIFGANFDATNLENNQVYFGATQAEVISATFGKLEVIVPVGASTAPISVKNQCDLTAYSKVAFNGIFCPTPLDNQTYANRSFDLTGVYGAYNMISQDMDLDGRPEVISAGLNRGITIARNNSTPGTLNFSAYNYATNTRTVATADFDGDGFKDLVTNVSVLRNTSTGPGSIGLAYATDSRAVSGYQIAAGDFNNDGKIDIIGANGSGVYLAFNTSTGPGNFNFTSRFFIATTGHCTGIQVADVDGDGKTDFLASQGPSNRAVSIRNITPNGSMTPSFEAPEYWSSDSDASDGIGTYPYRSMIADFDKDGKIDFTSCNYLGTTNTAIWRNISTVGNIEFAPTVNLPAPTRNYRIGVGDVDGDGFPDIVTKSLGVNVFSVYKNTSSGPGTPTFAPRIDYTSSWQAEVSGIVIGDLDGDFVPDIATSGINSNRILFHRNTSAQVDTDPPTALTKDITVALSPDGSVSITPEDVDNGSSDACGLDRLELNITDFTCVDIGENEVILTVYDNAGNSTSAPATVNVQPAAIIVTGQTTVCQGETIPMTANDGDSWQWQKDGVDIPGATQQTYVATESGAYTVTVINAGGCSGTSLPTNLTVNENPTVDVFPAGTAYICPNGVATLTASQSAIYQWMLDGVDIPNATQQTYNATVAGNYSVRVIDLFGCSAESNNVVVAVNPPEIDVTEGATPIATGSFSDYGDVFPNVDNIKTFTIANTGLNPLDVSDILINGADAQYFSVSGLGLPASIAAGTSATFDLVFNAPNITTYSASVTILSNDCDEANITFDVAAEITCVAAGFSSVPQSMTVSNDADQCSAVVNYQVSAVGNPAPDMTYTFSGATTGSGSGTGAGSTFNVGTTTVTLTVTNPCGNATESFDIVVEDNQDPVFTLPPDVTVNVDQDECSAVVNYNAPTVTDNCENYTVTQTAGLASGSAFPVGTTTNTFSMVSDSGESAVYTFNDLSTGPINGQDNWQVSNGGTGASTNAAAIASFSANGGYGGGQGLNMGDVGGNRRNYASRVNDANFSLPSANDNNIIEVVYDHNRNYWGSDLVFGRDNNSDGHITNNEVTFGVFDRDNGSLFRIYGPGRTVLVAGTKPGHGWSQIRMTIDLGANTFSVAYRDLTGNGSFIEPAAFQNVPAGFDLNASDHRNPKNINGMMYYHEAGGASQLDNIRYTVKESITHSFDVTVVDNVAPTVVTQDITVQLDASGNATITPDMIDNGSSDDCGIESITLDITQFDCNDVGGAGGPSPYGYWKAENDFADNTANGNNGTGIDNPAFVAGNCGQSFNFNGVGSHVDVGNDPVLNGAGGMTIMAWINPNSNGDEDQIASKSTHGVPSGWEFRRYGSTLQFTFKSQNNVQYAVSSGSLTFNSWQHVAATWDGTTMRLYRNGVQVGSTNVPSPIKTNSFSMKIGENQGFGNTHGAFNGSVDEVLFFDSALADADVSAIAATCNPAFGGGNEVTLTVTDVNGNVSTGTATVTVEDNIAPDVVTQDIVVDLDANGNVTITPQQVDNGSSDACGIESMTLSKTDFNCSNVGANTVTLTVTDVNGNVNSNTAVVTVRDVTAPNAVVQDIIVELDASGNVTITADDINNGSSDACGIQSLALSQTTFDCSNVGANTVTLTVTDANGNVDTATATVTVEDNIAPVAFPVNVSIDLDGTGNASVLAEDLVTGQYEEVGAESADVEGEEDVEEYEEPGAGSLIEQLYEAMTPVFDNCGIDTIVADKTDFTCADVGDNVVTVTVTDVNGNETVVQATVTVSDVTAAEVLTQDITVDLDASGNASITTAMIDAGSNDACGIASMELDVTDFDCTDTGANTVTLTVTDVNGNVSSNTAVVTVRDVTAPNVLTQNITIALDENGEATITASDIDGGTTDNCTFTLSIDNNAFNCNTLGANTVTLTATDASNNSSSMTATVTVIDNAAPTIVPNPITVQLDENGEASITAAQVDGGTYDNCAVASVTIDISSFNCDNLGNNTVTITATDVNGNTSTAEVNVEVIDIIPPTVGTRDISVDLDENGNVVITPEDVLIMSEDDIETDQDCEVSAAEGHAMWLSQYIQTEVESDCQCEGKMQNFTVRYNGPSGTRIKAYSQKYKKLFDRRVNNGDLITVEGFDHKGRLDAKTYLFVGYKRYEIHTSCSEDILGESYGPFTVISYTDGEGVFCDGTATNSDHMSIDQGSADTNHYYRRGKKKKSDDDDDDKGKRDDDDDDKGGKDDDDDDKGGKKDKGPKAENTRFLFDANGGNLLRRTDGTAQVTGVLVSTTDPTDKWEVELNLAAGMDWSTWSGLGRSYKDEQGLAGDNYLDWTYHIMDESLPSTLTGLERNAGEVITISHRPADYTFGFQIGDAANSKNANFGMSGWFTYTNRAGHDVQGDFNLDITNCEDQPIPDGTVITSDNCTIADTSLNIDSFSCTDLGENTVEVTVTDQSGNATTETATVTVNDNIAPTAIAQDITVSLGADGTVTIDPSQVDNGSFDNTECITMTLDRDTFDSDDIQSSRGKGHSKGKGHNYDDDDDDNDSGKGKAYGHKKDRAPKGQKVILTVTDGAGNTDQAVAYVTVVDDMAPTISTTPVTVALDKYGKAYIKASHVAPAVSDNCGVKYIKVAKTRFDCSDLGDNTVMVTAIDVNGNKTTGTVNVTVVDDIAPRIYKVPHKIVVTAYDSSCERPVHWRLPFAYDNCRNATLTGSHAPGDVFPVGDTEVTYTATDASGNTSTKSFIVTVKPSRMDIWLKADKHGYHNISCNGAEDGSVDATVRGGCAPYTYSWSNGASTEDLSNVGAGTYTLTVTDASGQTASKTVTLKEPKAMETKTYMYPKKPVRYYGEEYTIYLGYGAQQAVVKAKAKGGAGGYQYDWASDASIRYARKNYVVVRPQETTTYYVTINDRNGCVSEDSFTVRVKDVRGSNGKVQVCYNNQSMEVKRSQVWRMLKRGASLGECGELLQQIDIGSMSDDMFNSGTEGETEAAEFDEPVITLGASPNPVSTITTITFSSEVAGPAYVGVYNMQGVEVAKLYQGDLEADKNVEVVFDASTVPSGMMLVRLQTQGTVKTLKLMVKK